MTCLFDCVGCANPLAALCSKLAGMRDHQSLAVPALRQTLLARQVM